MRIRVLQPVMLALVLFLGLSGVSWAYPPGPPTIASTPSVPLGGPGVTIVTTLLIAGYGIWKNRK